MAISACELCGKPFNDALGKICSMCVKKVDETYTIVRKYMYQNPDKCDYINIVKDTEVSEKILNYLIKKGRIEVANKPGGAAKCRACGKETSGSSICEKCMARIVAEKLTAKKDTRPQTVKEKEGPRSYHTFTGDR
jgi:NMD protein affecting ribosome stability and mRNA decay